MFRFGYMIFPGNLVLKGGRDELEETSPSDMRIRFYIFNSKIFLYLLTKWYALLCFNLLVIYQI